MTPKLTREKKKKSESVMDSFEYKNEKLVPLTITKRNRKILIADLKKKAKKM